jgi:hypothetical protein
MDITQDRHYQLLNEFQLADFTYAVNIMRSYRGLESPIPLREAFSKWDMLKTKVPSLGKGSPQEDEFYILDAIVAGRKVFD